MINRHEKAPDHRPGHRQTGQSDLESTLADALRARVDSEHLTDIDRTYVSDKDMAFTRTRSTHLQRAAGIVVLCGLALSGALVAGRTSSSGGDELAAIHEAPLAPPRQSVNRIDADESRPLDSTQGDDSPSAEEPAASTLLIPPTFADLRNLPNPGPIAELANSTDDLGDPLLWRDLVLPQALASTGFREALFLNGAYVISNGRDLWVLDEQSARGQVDETSWIQIEVPEDHIVSDVFAGSGAGPGKADWLRFVSIGPMTGDTRATAWSINGSNQIDDTLTIQLTEPDNHTTGFGDLAPLAAPPASSWSDFAVWSPTNRPRHAVVDGQLVLAQGFTGGIDGQQILADRGALPDGATLCEFLTTGTSLTIAYSVTGRTDLECVNAADKQEVTYSAAALGISEAEMRWLSGLGPDPESSMTMLWVIEADGQLSPLVEVPGVVQRLDVSADRLIVSAFGRTGTFVSSSNGSDLQTGWTTLALPGSMTIGNSEGMVVFPLEEPEQSLYWIGFDTANAGLGTLENVLAVRDLASSVGSGGLALVTYNSTPAGEGAYTLWIRPTDQPWLAVATNKRILDSELHVVVGASSILLLTSDQDNPLGIQIAELISESE